MENQILIGIYFEDPPFDQLLKMEKTISDTQPSIQGMVAPTLLAGLDSKHLIMNNNKNSYYHGSRRPRFT